ncbi:dipeptide ABC transporter ATP-binding protein [Agrococcus carbonis]|uniref:Peptide/nickel transport system ATP-binding protein n=1 Tax=Agrococcus carbonis TaxID=684552 RepID=A0A1H1KSS4_9MICO|nr:ABC transporter ATP-binding protein [Agrococcus carbonis]SDR65354.1 peptide/nickel transport system ATP-binding protein [Agrococcus carbonis]
MSALLTIDDLAVSYHARGERRTAVHGVSLELQRGEVLALVGESGSGKTTIGQSIIGLLAGGGRVDRGSVQLQLSGGPVELTRLPGRALQQIRGARVALVPQDPGTSLNPVQTIGDSVAAPLRIHRWGTREAIRRRALDLLDRVGLDDPERRAKQYPHELSGGMRQRALIAAAVALEPDLIIADEPTSALDVTVQRRILDLLDSLRDELGSSVLLITHDLAVAAERADSLAVLRGGRLEEAGPARDVLEAPTSAYTAALLADAPALDDAPPRAPRPADALDDEPLVAIDGLVHEYGRGRDAFRAVDEVSLRIERGATHALVGESGSGKTTIGRALAGFHRPTSGSIGIGDLDVVAERGSRRLRHRVQLVSQNPFASLDPRRTIGQTVGEPLQNLPVAHGGERDRKRLAERVATALEQVALPAEVAERLPRELSGGQRQRVAIARALIIEPEVVVLDEAVSALDVTVQAQILALLERLQRDLGLTYLFITHDLAVVRRIADTATVLRGGRAVETGTAHQVLTDPQHDYTRALLDAVPAPDWLRDARRGLGRHASTGQLEVA